MPDRSVETFTPSQPGKPYDLATGTRTTSTIEVAQEQVNADMLVQRLRDALDTNRTYLGRASPTAAQNTTQIKDLTKQVNGIIRLLFHPDRLDVVD